MIEALVYTVIVALLFVVVINTLLVIINVYRSSSAYNSIQNSAITSFERITREIRNASGVSLSGSSFDTSPGVLVLSSTDDDGDPITVEFSVVGDRLHLIEDGVDQGPLTSNDVEITDLVFRFAQATSSQLIRTEMTLQSGEEEAERSEIFQISTVLRGSY